MLIMMLKSTRKDPCESPYTAQEAERKMGIVARDEIVANVRRAVLSTEGLPVFW